MIIHRLVMPFPKIFTVCFEKLKITRHMLSSFQIFFSNYCRVNLKNTFLSYPKQVDRENLQLLLFKTSKNTD